MSAPTTIARAAQGTTLAYSTDAGVTWIQLGEVSSISGGGGGEVGKRETTVLTSTIRTYRPTITDPGELKVSLNFDPADSGHQQLRTWLFTPLSTDPSFQVTFATSPAFTATFTGFVVSVDGPNAEDVDDNLTADVTIQITSAPVLAQVS